MGGAGEGELSIQLLEPWAVKVYIIIIINYTFILHCHYRHDFCIKMGTDESHCNVSLIVRGKVTRPCPQTTTEDKRERKQGVEQMSPAYQPNAFTAGPTRLIVTDVRRHRMLIYVHRDRKN